jgi:hemolysin III
MLAATTTHPVKPLLRGVSHEVAAGAALAAWVVLAVLAPTPRGRAAALVYGGSLFTLFAVSALYHRPTWKPRARAVMRRLDHSAIFVLIAGTYTPLCLLLGGTSGTRLLALVWAGAFLGVVKSVVWAHAPRVVVATLTVALGWAVVPVVPALDALLGGAGVGLLMGGGVLYTLGAIVYATRRPNPFPRVFGYHEIFHALVVAAAALHLAVAGRAVLAIP